MPSEMIKEALVRSMLETKFRSDPLLNNLALTLVYNLVLFDA